MNTQRLKLNDEIRQQKTDCSATSIPLDSDERLLYSEAKVPFEGSTLESAIPLFLILGSPLHAIVGFAAITSFISEKTLAQFCSEMNVPLVSMLVLLLACIALAKTLPLWNRVLCPAGSKFVITTKRIFDHLPGGILPVAFECPYTEMVNIYPVESGKQNWLKVRFMKYDSEVGRKIETTHQYMVKNANSAYMHLPDSVRLAHGLNSRNKSSIAQKERVERITYSLLGLFMLGFFGLIAILVYVQTFCHDIIKQGMRAYRLGDYGRAEILLKDGYDKIKPFSFHAEFGPSAYRYAEILEHNGKAELAIPKYKEAVAHCNWLDDEADITWKPAVFRSNWKLGEIYRQLKQTQQAEVYFDKALATATLEHEEKRARDFFLSYKTWLEQQGKVGKAASVHKLSQIYKAAPAFVKVFRDF